MTYRAECISCKCDHSPNGSRYLTHSQITSRRSNLEKRIQWDDPLGEFSILKDFRTIPPFVLLTRVTCTSAHATRQIANPVVRTSHTTTFEFAIRTRKIIKKFSREFLYSLIAHQIHARKKFVFAY